MTDTTKDIAIDFLLRLLAVCAVGAFVVRASAAYHADPTRVTLLIQIVSEVVTIVIMLTSRRPASRDWHWVTVVAVVYAMTTPFLFSVEPGIKLLGDATGVVLQMAGILLSVWAKLVLGRSFGLLPANRGIVEGGPYRIVRHPIYLGYLIGHIGFLAVNFSLHNAIVLATLYVAQIYRILREEEFLMTDQRYREYAAGVPYRLIHGVY